MPVYRSMTTEQPSDQFTYVLNDVQVKGTPSTTRTWCLYGSIKGPTKPPAVDWLRQAIETEFAMAGLVASQDKNTALPSLDIVVEQFFVEQVDNFFPFLILCDQAAITMVRVKLTSSDGSIAFERRFVGHIESINQVAYVYPFFPHGKGLRIGRLAPPDGSKALSGSCGGNTCSLRTGGFNELYPIFNL